jgi:hypothetical protein
MSNRSHDDDDTEADDPNAVFFRRQANIGREKAQTTPEH